MILFNKAILEALSVVVPFREIGLPDDCAGSCAGSCAGDPSIEPTEKPGEKPCASVGNSEAAVHPEFTLNAIY
jgi:hypothetical protein